VAGPGECRAAREVKCVAAFPDEIGNGQEEKGTGWFFEIVAVSNQPAEAAV